ncbi:hypothetical protein MMPV_004259 [Pyropia vietnamensis]
MGAPMAFALAWPLLGRSTAVARPRGPAPIPAVARSPPPPRRWMTARGRARCAPVVQMSDPPPTSLDALPAIPYALVWTPPPPDSTASDPLAGTGAYAIFDARARLRYVGYAKNLRPRLALHGRRVPAACHSVKVYLLPPGAASEGGDPRAAMEAILDGWLAAAGAVPDGNAMDRARWEEDPPEARSTVSRSAVAGGGPRPGRVRKVRPPTAPLVRVRPPPRRRDDFYDAADGAGAYDPREADAYAERDADVRGPVGADAYDPLDPFSAARSAPEGYARRARRRRPGSAASVDGGGRRRGVGGADWWDRDDVWSSDDDNGRGRRESYRGDGEWTEREDWVPIVGVAVIAGFLWLATTLAGGGGGVVGGGTLPM